MHRPAYTGFLRYAQGLFAGVLCSAVAEAAESTSLPDFRKDIQPLLNQYCSDCHADGMSKGNVDFDTLKPEAAVPGDPKLWLAVLKNLRAGLMPPAKKDQPTEEQKLLLETWIKRTAFGLDPLDPDPGRVTVRRLNRVEYRNTVRDLLGVDYRTDEEFPADDTGHGFDNLGEVLTISPMLLEKYLAAARVIVEQAVPLVPRVPAEKVLSGRSFRKPGATGGRDGSQSFSYYEAATVTNSVTISQAGKYQVLLNLNATERFVDNVFDYNRCRVVLKADGEEVWRKEFSRENGRAFRFEFERDWAVGDHQLQFEIEPLTPDEKQVRSLALQLNSVTLRGPMEPEHWVRPKNYEKYFTRETPVSPEDRHAYAGELLGKFAARAYRRPVDSDTIKRLADLAAATYQQPGKTFEAGIAQGMVAILASPRFLFREEDSLPAPDGGHPLIDEYSLASRLSYFLWSSMPDDPLIQLAAAGQLRAQLPAQLKRMLADGRSAAFIQNFTGQWLQARDIESVTIDARAVLNREEKPDPEIEKKRSRFRELRNRTSSSLTSDETAELDRLRGELFRSNNRLRAELTGDLRRAMRRETEMSFDYVLREDRSLRELINSDYTFLNERLAQHYGLTNLNVAGEELRRVTLPPDSPRGGILTQGTVLAVTSNPTRTSPVKRGVFVLENILGTPAPPPPPDIPPLEEAGKAIKDHPPTLRETLELHRKQPVCSSCHNRMDPLGLALENFNALGMWREQEAGQPVDVTGKLITGESFQNIQELKRILANERRHDFYHCLAEKLLTYALGRGLDHADTESLDQIVAQLEKSDGRPSVLLQAIVESAPFQKRRKTRPEESLQTRPAPGQRADLRKQP